MCPSRVARYQNPLSWTFSKFLLAPICELVIVFKILMYVLSHGCLLSSYKAFLHLHTWFTLSCASTPTGYKYLFIVYAFFLWEASCYESFLVSHNASIYCMLELRTSLHVLILHPRHHSSWPGLPFLPGRFYINDVAAFIILFFILNYCHLFFGTSLHSSLLVGDYV